MKDKTVTEKEVLAEIKEAEKMFNNRFLYPYYNNRSEAFIFAYILYHFGVESIAPSATWTCGDKAINAIQIHDTSVVMHPNVSVKGTPLPWFWHVSWGIQ